MKFAFLTAVCVASAFGPAQATGDSASLSSAVELRLSVGRSCLLVSRVMAPAATSKLVLKCNRGSVAPQSPMEVVAAPLADWRLVDHERSVDGGELFTYTIRKSTPAAAVAVNFY